MLSKLKYKPVILPTFIIMSSFSLQGRLQETVPFVFISVQILQDPSRGVEGRQ